MEYPRRVRVVYSDGAEETGTARDPRHVDVGSMGLQVRLREIITIDSVPHLVAHVQRNHEPPESEVDGKSRCVRLSQMGGIGFSFIR
jgi:hypothetical protein